MAREVEPSHLSFTLSRRLMRDFGLVIGVAWHVAADQVVMHQCSSQCLGFGWELPERRPIEAEPLAQMAQSCVDLAAYLVSSEIDEPRGEAGEERLEAQAFLELLLRYGDLRSDRVP